MYMYEKTHLLLICSQLIKLHSIAGLGDSCSKEQNNMGGTSAVLRHASWLITAMFKQSVSMNEADIGSFALSLPSYAMKWGSSFNMRAARAFLPGSLSTLLRLARQLRNYAIHLQLIDMSAFFIYNIHTLRNILHMALVLRTRNIRSRLHTDIRLHSHMHKVLCLLPANQTIRAE